MSDGTNTPSPMDRLMDETRIKGVTRMIPDNIDPARITEQMAHAVIDKITAYKKDHQISSNSIARAIGYSNSVVSQTLRMKYTGDWRPVILDLDRWLEAQIRRDAAPKVNHFVWTKVAEEILSVANACITLKRIGLVHGPTTSGIGKTLALKAIALDKPGTIFITALETSNSIKGLLRLLCHELHVSDEGSNDDRFRRIVDKLAGTPRLLIVDQIHNLCGSHQEKLFYVLADLWDATQAPQLWCGTSDLMSYLDRGQAAGREPLAQIRRRIAIHRDLLERTREGTGPGEPLYTIDEIRSIFGKGKMRLAPDAAQFLHRLACLPNGGALGACTNIVEMAIALYEPQGVKVLTAQICRAVQKGLVGWKSAAVIDARIEETAPLAAVG